jgi:predicted metal-dependent peptidase
MTTLNTEERLTRARIKLQARNPFFSYLSFYLKFKESKELPEWAGMGVNPTGDLFYRKEFVDKLTDEQLIGVLCHEILHLALLHLLRRANRQLEGWNIACDLVTNSMLKKQGFDLPDGVLVTQYDDFNIGKIKIKNVSEKTAEQIYDELPKEFQQQQKQIAVTFQLKGFDEHDENENEGEGKGKGGSVIGEARRNALENEWQNRIEEAYVNAKARGNVPDGIERYIGELRKAQISWKALLQKYTINEIPSDYTWAKKSKKSMATGYYMPDTIKEKIDVIVSIDTSGSIGKEEMTEFISEIIGIAKAYSQQINMRLLTHDCEIHDDYEVRNGNIEQIKKLQIHGGGGTSHKKVFSFVKDKIRNAKVLICQTDGESDIDEINFEDYRFKKIFVISKNGTDRQLGGKNCKIIKLK